MKTRTIYIAIAIAAFITLLDGQVFDDLFLTTMYKLGEFFFFLIMGIWVSDIIQTTKNKEDI